MPGGSNMGLGRMNYLGGDARNVRLDRASTRRVFGYFAPYRLLIAVIVVCVLAGAVVGLLPPLAIRYAIDEALPRHNKALLGWLVLALVLLPLTEGLINILQHYLNTRIGQGIMRDLRIQLFSHLQKMSLRFFTRVRFGEIVSRLNNDINGIQDITTRIFVQLATNFVIVISTIIVMASLDWKLTLLSLFALPILIVPVRRVGGIRQRLRRKIQEQHGELNSHLQEVFGISGAVHAKVFGQEDRERDKFSSFGDRLMSLEIRIALVGRWFALFISLAAPVSTALVFWYGGYAVIDGVLTIGTIVAFTAYLGRLYTPFSQLLNVHIDFLTALAVFDRLFEYLDMEPEITSRPGAIALPPARGQVVFENVSFSYEQNGWQLTDVSFEAVPGEIVALVGPSGAGKTTIAYLLLRLYDAERGAIRIDGHEIRDVTIGSLRAQTGIAMQEPFLMHTTIRENLLYAKPGATDEELTKACQAAFIHDFIGTLPCGLDTVVGERGYKLSGGEKQRIALARVFLKDPRILILDEATSAVDAKSEAAVQAAMDSLMRNRTTFVIAHRLSTIMAASRILVLDGGRIVESGRHDELLGQGGIYADLYRRQFLQTDMP